jgi:hypothetical protein
MGALAKMVRRRVAAHDAAGSRLTGGRIGAGQAREPPISRSARPASRKVAAALFKVPCLSI